MKSKAIEKIKAELDEIKNGNKYINVVRKPVATALISFCEQQEEFAQAIVQSDKKLLDCLTEVVRGAGSALSDIEAYRRAVQFYFPGAVVDMVLSIRMSEYEAKPEIEVTDKLPKSQMAGNFGELNFSLLDLL